MLVWPFDIIIASEDARFSDPVVAFGVNGVEYFAELGTGLFDNAVVFRLRMFGTRSLALSAPPVHLDLCRCDHAPSTPSWVAGGGGRRMSSSAMRSDMGSLGPLARP